MTMTFAPASKTQAYLRCAVFGPSGAGKTFSALRIAAGIAAAGDHRIACIDTERRTASKYADRFRFDVLDLTDPDIEAYEAAIKAAAAAGYKVLIIDSLTHGWQSLLEEVDKLAMSKYRGNTWSAWSEGTPKQRKLVKALLDFPGHIIATMRSKTEWTTTTNDRGRQTPTRVGLTPEQGKGIEYEFDLLLELNTDHHATVIKDRTGKFQDKIIEKPGEEFGTALHTWLMDGDAPPPAPTPSPEPAKPEPSATFGGKRAADLIAAFGKVGVDADAIRAHLTEHYPDAVDVIKDNPAKWPAAWTEVLVAFLNDRKAAKKAEAEKSAPTGEPAIE